MFVIFFGLCFIGCVACVQDSHVAECGKMSSTASGLIQGGHETGREAFPWIVNIFTKYHGAELFAGSGSLISEIHILCAANSVAYENYLDDSLDLNPEQNYIAYDAENVKIIMGSSHYKQATEPGALSVDGASKIILHPSLFGTKPRIFNIALIFMKSAVAFSKFVSPVCLASRNDGDVFGKTLYAVGYGVDQSGAISLTKRHVPMVALDELTCQRFYNETMQKGKSGKFFCARGNGLETPCRFDKPLYVKYGDQWHLQAMSSVFKVFKNKLCRPRAPVLYEDISSMTNWIESEVVNNQI